MRTIAFSVGVLVLACAGCAHVTLSQGELQHVHHPAFISRMEGDAGPKCSVFRDDSSFKERLKGLDAKEADRRLAAKLVSGVPRFEVAERLRAQTFSMLPQDPPWTDAVNPADVARVLESLLVEEVPARAPDYKLLKQTGADSVVEFVIEEFGLRGGKGKAYTYMRGYGRMFYLEGGTIWKRAYEVEQNRDNSPGFDPLVAAKDPQIFRVEVNTLIDSVASQFSKDLSGGERRAPAPKPASESELAPDNSPL